MRGLTLIEILIAMGIASLVGMLLLVIMVNSAGLFSHQSSKVKTGLDINDALAKIRTTIKQANAIALSYTDGGTTYTSGVNQLILKVVSIDTSGNISDNTYDYFVIFADQNILHLKVFPDPTSSRLSADQILSTSLDSLVFKYFNNVNPPVEVPPQNAARVSINLNLKQKIGISSEINSATSEANLRND